MKYLNVRPPARLTVVLTLFSVLSLSLLVQCDRSSSSDQTSSSDSSTQATADETKANPSGREFDRADGFEQGPQDIKEKRTFTLTDAYTIGPVEEGADQLRAWLEVPLETRQQTVHEITIDAGDLTYELTEEPQLGNRFLYIEIDNPAGTYDVVVNSRVTRHSVREPYRDGRPDDPNTHYLRETSEVPVNEEMKKLALEEGASGNDRESMRNIYEFVVDHSTYYKANPAEYRSSGSGDIEAEYCLYQKQGGCTDFHALYMSMGRSVNIPTRFVIGSFLPPEFEGTDKGVSYHCWAEAYLDGEGWLPLDASYADLWPDLHDFYFGQLDARRVAFSRGRGITLAPESNHDVNYFIKGHIELDGDVYDNWDRKLTFQEVN